MYTKDILNNGIRVIMEDIPYVNSVSIGVWVENGSKNEDKHINGVSHFIEHLLFKGTKKRTSKEIAETIDNIGGQINAFTTKECTCYYAKVLDEYINIAVDVLSDMINSSLFNEEDIIKEKSVIYEEIKMYQDSPEDLVYDLLSETMFENTSLALPILGTENSLKTLNRQTIVNYFNTHYIPSNIVISVVGNINNKETIKLLENSFGNFNINHMNSNCEHNNDNYLFKRKIKGIVKDTEQLNMCIGMEGIPIGDDNIYPLLIMNNVFGGSMSSRLFQRIREEKGLVYSVYSHPSSYKGIGSFNIYAGLSEKQIYKVIQLIKEDIEDIKVNCISQNEFLKSKEQLKGNYILGLESTSSRMSELGRSELILGKIHSPKEKLEKIEKVNMDQIEYIIHRVFDYDKFNIAYVGKVKYKDKLEKNVNNILFS